MVILQVRDVFVDGNRRFGRWWTRRILYVWILPRRGIMVKLDDVRNLNNARRTMKIEPSPRPPSRRPRRLHISHLCIGRQPLPAFLIGGL